MFFKFFTLTISRDKTRLFCPSLALQAKRPIFWAVWAAAHHFTYHPTNKVLLRKASHKPPNFLGDRTILTNLFYQILRYISTR